MTLINIMELMKRVRLSRYNLRRLEKKKSKFAKKEDELIAAFKEQQNHIKVIESLLQLHTMKNYV